MPNENSQKITNIGKKYKSDDNE